MKVLRGILSLMSLLMLNIRGENEEKRVVKTLDLLFMGLIGIQEKSVTLTGKGLL